MQKMSDSSSQKPKLIIDEDWKTQVARERDEARQKQAGPDVPAVGDNLEGDQPLDVKSQSKAEQDDLSTLPPPPPASFPFLVSMLGTQALAALGQLGDGQDAPAPRLDYAKHYIDLLDVLEGKTQGNLTTDESKLLADWLYQLRMGYVEIAKHK
jgi:Domain of unknown function (DUF1844)